MRDIWIGEDRIDLRDVAEAAADPDHGDYGEAVSIRAAFIGDGLVVDADGFAEYAEVEPDLIEANSFVAYAQELAEDVGAVPDDAEWPLRHIDWESAARELLYDYTAVDLDGNRYYVRTF